MRKSVQKKHHSTKVAKRQAAERRYRVVSALVGTWVLVISGLIVLALLTTWGIERQNKREIVLASEHELLLGRLEQQRQAREKSERSDIAREISVAASADSPSLTPIDLGDRQCNHSSQRNDPSQISVMVNKQHCLVPLGYVPKLVSVAGAEVAEPVAEDFSRLMSAATAAGVPLRITSSYRSYADQVSTYAYWLSVEPDEKAVKEVSALPGYSEHQTGFAVDFAAGDCALQCFTDTAQYDWMMANAHKYGFVERYPKGQQTVTGYAHESWHFRYVGPEVATGMKQKLISTLEKYWNMPGGDYE